MRSRVHDEESGAGYAVWFDCQIGFWEMVGHIILWIVLIIVTLGIALFFVPYSVLKFAINRTRVLDQNERIIGRLRCEFGLAGSIGHVILWILLTIITLGIAYFFYVYRVLRVVLSETRIEYI